MILQCHWKNLLSLKNISSNQLFSNSFSRNVTFTKFFPITTWNFPQFPSKSKKFRQIDIQNKSLVKKLIWRNFCKKLWGKILKFLHCVGNTVKFIYKQVLCLLHLNFRASNVHRRAAAMRVNIARILKLGVSNQTKFQSFT